MTTDDLTTPLGIDKPLKKRRYRLPFTAPQALTAVFGAFILGFVGFAIFNDNPMGGEPLARIAIAPSSTMEAAKPSAMPQVAPPVAKAPVESRTVTIIDGSSGKRQDMVIGGGDSASSSDATKPGESSAPAVAAAINPKLLENSKHGMIPVVADGLKPFRAYAAPSDLARAAKTPVVAIVIGGLGVGAAKTNDAIMKLPGAVTLAFTPYGSDPGKLVERARAQKHEIVLQVPMEPFDYPDNDPGPQTLLTNLTPEQNIDRLAWHMSRFQGYVGIANFMGSRFVVTDPAMQPIVKEAARRGLGYLDDGAAQRSLAGPLAEAQAMPFGKATATIDAVPTPAEIDRVLASLESTAKDRGMAIGVASALPVSIDRIAQWARTLESRGIMLVPLTTAMMKSKSGPSN